MLAHLIFGVFANAEPHLASQTIKNLLEPFLGGTFDVCVFFVLSGDALSSSHWRTPFQRDFVARLITRYVRLAVPIGVASLAVFLLVKFELVYVKEAGALLNSGEWLGAFLQGNYTLEDVLSYSFANVFLRHDPHTDLIPFLWTMKTEWFGSLATICYLYAEDLIPFKGKILFLAFVLCVWLDSTLACFVFGVICGHWRRSGAFAKVRSRAKMHSLTCVSSLGAVIIATYCNRVWQDWFLPSIIGSCIFVLAACNNYSFCKFLSLPISRRLGQLSYPLYLIQFPVIISFTSGMVCLASTRGILSPLTMWLIVFCSAGLSLLFAVIFSPIDKWAISLRRGVYALSEGRALRRLSWPRLRSSIRGIDLTLGQSKVPIVAGAPPKVHAISDNWHLDKATGRELMITDASFVAPSLKCAARVKPSLDAFR
jgi:peptidoglycan/LPS O-acetylase OafA/YrhL